MADFLRCGGVVTVGRAGQSGPVWLQSTGSRGEGPAVKGGRVHLDPTAQVVCVDSTGTTLTIALRFFLKKAQPNLQVLTPFATLNGRLGHPAGWVGVKDKKPRPRWAEGDIKALGGEPISVMLGQNGVGQHWVVGDDWVDLSREDLIRRLKTTLFGNTPKVFLMASFELGAFLAWWRLVNPAPVPHHISCCRLGRT